MIAFALGKANSVLIEIRHRIRKDTILLSKENDVIDQLEKLKR